MQSARPTDVDGAPQERMPIVIAGHVDHGKSTIIGRLLADTGSLPQGKLEQVRASCERNARPFEYAFLLDALKDEQSQGITIDSARVFFKSDRRHYIIIDAPGHIEFLKNMVTGAARAEAGLLVIDAQEGVQENSRRHGYMMSMLGIRQIAVLVNKMDLVAFDRRVFDDIVTEYSAFLQQIDIRPTYFVPVSGREGDNIAHAGSRMPWYEGSSVLQALDAFQAPHLPVGGAFRMAVQGVYKFTQHGDDRRIVAGTVQSGTVNVGDEVVFYPSGKKSHVQSVEAFSRPSQHQAMAGQATGFTLSEQIFVSRGEVVALASEPHPKVTSLIRTNLFWLGKDPLVKNRDYTLKLGTARVHMRLDQVHRVIDASDLSAHADAQHLNRHDVADCTLKLKRAIAFDLAEDIAATSRFVVVDGYEIRGGGIIREALQDQQAWVREKVLLRNYKWEPSIIAPEHRAEKYNQRSTLLLITGAQEADRKTVAKGLEARLFDDGRVVYFLGIGNVLYGVDADIERTFENRKEHLRRLGEIANLMLDAGVILVVTAAELTQEELQLIRTSVGSNRIEVVWVGENVTTDLAYDVLLSEHESIEEQVFRLKDHLQEAGIIYRPW
ncbi:MAG: adenylyl-sulfate kinase [Gemmatimonadales bacterium]|nr:adenylyl-sulfate kinase [Gemmatimonadales bacterium]